MRESGTDLVQLVQPEAAVAMNRSRADFVIMTLSYPTPKWMACVCVRACVFDR